GAEAACCYFAAKDKDVLQPAQKAFITWDPAEKVESFTVQPKFEGNARDFGMVIPTPGRPRLAEMPPDFFNELPVYTLLNNPHAHALPAAAPPAPQNGASWGGGRVRRTRQGPEAGIDGEGSGGGGRRQPGLQDYHGGARRRPVRLAEGEQVPLLRRRGHPRLL